MIKLFYVDCEDRRNPQSIHHICEWGDFRSYGDEVKPAKCIHQDDLPMYLEVPTGCCCSSVLYIKTCTQCGYIGPDFEDDWNNLERHTEVQEEYFNQPI